MAVLQPWDYVVFSLMLAISSAIGIYYACTGGKQRTQTEFLMANHSMGIFPVALSLLASFMSAITLLGTPSEMYQNTTMYWMIGPSYIIVCFVAAHIFLPVFYNLNITSAYEYLELRFNRVLRIQGCITFLLQMVMYMGIVLYAPALALSAVTGLPWVLSIIILGVVCTFYTTIGGMKAVMWTDVFQILIMFSGMIAIVVLGAKEVGGFGKVWEIMEQNNKVEFWTADTDPTRRHTVWNLIFGGACTWLVIYGVNQSQVQRYLTTPTLRKAQIAIWINLPGLWGLLTVCALAGIVAFAYYANNVGCDPLSEGTHITKGDQILPYFVMDVLDYPGFPGLFIATVFSGALSTVSSGVNALAAVTLEDIIKPICNTWWPHHFEHDAASERRGAIICKVLALCYGVLALILAFVASFMGDVLQAALGLFGMVGGPLLGIFILGMLFPCANWQGACAGHIFGEIMSLWVGFGSYIYKYKAPKPTPVTFACQNLTTSAPMNATSYQGLEIYKLSYMWQGGWAILCTVTMGLIVSAIFNAMDRKKVVEKRASLDPRLFCLFFDEFFPCLPKSWRKVLRCGVRAKSGHEIGPSRSRGPSKMADSSASPVSHPVDSTVAYSKHPSDAAYSNPTFQLAPRPRPPSYTQHGGYTSTNI